MLLVFNLKSPHKIQVAVKSIYAALLAVLATLKLEFAQTTAIAMGIADMVQKPIVKFADADDGSSRNSTKAGPSMDRSDRSIRSFDRAIRSLSTSRGSFVLLRGLTRRQALVAEGIVNILVEGEDWHCLVPGNDRRVV